jgi:hypothetical protein
MTDPLAEIHIHETTAPDSPAPERRSIEGNISLSLDGWVDGDGSGAPEVRKPTGYRARAEADPPASPVAGPSARQFGARTQQQKHSIAESGRCDPADERLDPATPKQVLFCPGSTRKRVIPPTMTQAGPRRRTSAHVGLWVLRGRIGVQPRN